MSSLHSGNVTVKGRSTREGVVSVKVEVVQIHLYAVRGEEEPLPILHNTDLLVDVTAETVSCDCCKCVRGREWNLGRGL